MKTDEIVTEVLKVLSDKSSALSRSDYNLVLEELIDELKLRRSC